jgi:hypothetical protein
MKKHVWLIKAPDDNRDPYLTNMCKDQLEKIEKELGCELEFTEDFDVFAAQPLRLFYIGSGGSEMLFRAVYDKVEGPYYLLTQRAHNSLAASMEIQNLPSFTVRELHPLTSHAHRSRLVNQT